MFSLFRPGGDGAEKDDEYLHLPQPSKETIDLIIAQHQSHLALLKPIAKTPADERLEVKSATTTSVQDDLHQEDEGYSVAWPPKPHTKVTASRLRQLQQQQKQPAEHDVNEGVPNSKVDVDVSEIDAGYIDVIPKEIVPPPHIYL